MVCEYRFPPMTSFYKHIQRLLILAIFLSSKASFAQSTVLRVNSEKGVEIIPVQSEWQLQRAKNTLLWEWVEKGHLFASLDSVSFNSDTVIYQLRPGYKVDLDDRAQEMLAERDRLLSKYWNEGYPFARLYYDSIEYTDEDQVNTRFRVEKGPFIVFDSLRVFGDVNYGALYLQSASGIKFNDAFSESRYQEVSSRLSKLKIARLRNPPDIGFAGGKATVILHLEKVASDKFEGILGVLPSQEANRTDVTGYLNLELNNLFRSGKQFHINWNRFAPSAQSLDIQYTHPFFLQSPMAIQTDFSIFRQDSLFVKRNFSLVFSVPISKDLDFSMAVGTEASDILGAEPSADFGLDYRTTTYTPGFTFRNDLFAKRFENGLFGKLGFGFGDKRINRNQLFPTSTYDTVQLRSSNYQLDFFLSGQKTLGRNKALFAKFETGLLEGQQILINEYYRIGGLRSLRGFNENNFFVQDFMKIQSEYRFFFEQSSFLFGLMDWSLMNLLQDQFFTSSVGGGLSLDTGSGDFELVFAIGSVDGLDFDFQSTKVHFGYSITF